MAAPRASGGRDHATLGCLSPAEPGQAVSAPLMGKRQPPSGQWFCEDRSPVSCHLAAQPLFFSPLWWRQPEEGPDEGAPHAGFCLSPFFPSDAYTPVFHPVCSCRCPAARMKRGSRFRVFSCFHRRPAGVSAPAIAAPTLPSVEDPVPSHFHFFADLDKVKHQCICEYVNVPCTAVTAGLQGDAWSQGLCDVLPPLCCLCYSFPKRQLCP